MKKLNLLLVTFFLLVAFTGVNDCLFGVVNDINGQGNALWGDTKARTKNRFAKRARLKEVAVTEGPNFIIASYRKGQVMKKRYDFKNNRLFRITLTYTHSGQRIVNNYNRKYKPFNKIENNTYIWKFPSTIITYRKGTSYAVFIDRTYVSSVITGHKNIDNVRLGMTANEVRRLMGTPIATATAPGNITTYRYKTGIVTFKNLKVAKIEKAAVARQTNIDKVRIGMTTDEVKRIMGMPLTSTAAGNTIIYRYKTGAITFKFLRVVEIAKGTPTKATKVIKKIK